METHTDKMMITKYGTATSLPFYISTLSTVNTGTAFSGEGYNWRLVSFGLDLSNPIQIFYIKFSLRKNDFFLFIVVNKTRFCRVKTTSTDELSGEPQLLNLSESKGTKSMHNDRLNRAPTLRLFLESNKLLTTL